MFGLFKSDPKKKLEKQYHSLLEQGMQMQRNGNIKEYSMLSEQAEAVRKQIDELEAEQAKS